MWDFKRLGTDVLALLLLAVVVVSALSLASYHPADPPGSLVYPPRLHVANWCGPLGASIAHHARTYLGLGAYLVVLVLFLLDMRLFSRNVISDPVLRLLGGFLITTAFCAVLQGLIPGIGGGAIIGSGGYLGAWTWVLLEEHFKTAGICAVLGAMFFAGLLISTDLWLIQTLIFVFTWPWRTLVHWQSKQEESWPDESSWPDVEPTIATEAETSNPAPAQTMAAIEEVVEAVEEVPIAPKAIPVVSPMARMPLRVNAPYSVQTARKGAIQPPPQPPAMPVPYALPDPELLSLSEEFPYELLAKKAQLSAATLEKTFREFGLNVRVVEVDTGPVITQFELELEAGLRLSKVVALADDLAIALRVPSVRVVAPIPGKNTVGVEVPNEKQVMVRLRDLIESCQTEAAEKRIPLFLGKDVSGRPLIVDMAKMPHLLIAGRTGTGKSVCLNTLILSILMTRTPDQVKMLMIDPKMVELSPYSRIPHLMHPVITDMKKAEAVLGWAVEKMEERYDLLARCGVRHLDTYNKLGKEAVIQRLDLDPDSPEADEIPESMPYIVIIADEMADMMMTSGKEVEASIIRLAQKSRAVGIHLVLATQKPTVDVITGLIKSNLPARVAFQVASRTDSRVVLDEMGADKLLGNGDMLYLAPGTSNLTRAQGTYVSDDEINAIIDFYSDQPPQYSRELQQLKAAGSNTDAKGLDGLKSRDELYEQAIEVVIREGRGSVSLLQRALGIGYGRAARLIDFMAEDGIVGAYNGAQAREVLYTIDQWHAMLDGADMEPADA